MNPRALQNREMHENGLNLENAGSGTSPLKEFLSLIKIGIVISNLITVFAGIWLALYFSGLGFMEHFNLVLFTLAGTALIIAGSCSINNYLDRDIDTVMERTKGRPTVTGRVKPNKALGLGVVFIFAGIIFLFQTTKTAAILGITGVFSYVVLYTIWTKRRFAANTIVGSISGAVPPLIGWTAVDTNLNVMALGLFLIMFLWQPPHFYSLAMRRVDDYKRAGVPMLPVVKGPERTKMSIMMWIALLLPTPLLLSSLGTSFIALASLLNLGWLASGFYYYRKKPPKIWAQKMFIYSLQYLTILFLSMVVITLF